jgi:type 1 glutamine amidotransferase
MKRLLPGLCALVFQLAPTSSAAEKIKVLLVDGQNNHNWKQTTPVLVDALQSAGCFAVTVSTTPDNKAPKDAWNDWHPKFSDYAVVVSNYNGQDWPVSVQHDFEDFVKNGGGFVSVHAADNSFPGWKAFNEMIGVGGWGGRDEKSGPWLYLRDGKPFRDSIEGKGGTHGKQHEFVVDICPTDHPITRGLPAKWMHAQDELYSRLRGPAAVEILSTSHSDTTDRDEPNLMVRNFGKGRVAHTTLGHADYSMLERGFYLILQRCTEWAATGDVKETAAVPKDFNTAEKVSVVRLDGYPQAIAPPAKKP